MEKNCDGCCYRQTCNHDLKKCCYLVKNRCIINEFEEKFMRSKIK